MNGKTEETGCSAPAGQPPVPPPYWYPVPEEEEIDLLEYGRVIWKNRKLIAAVTFAAALLAALVSLMMPNIYRAEVLLAPVGGEGGKGGGLAGALGGLGGIASLAGISLPAGGNTEEALAVLKSRAFIWKFVRDNKLMPVLFADDWDAAHRRWKERDPEKRPGMWDAYRLLTKSVMKVDKDKKTGLVTVAVEWKDAELAAKWANALVARVNEYLRQRAITESDANLKYLNRELARTQVEDIRKTLFELISQEQKKAMLANTREQYAFRVLDSAEPPDKKARPKRTLIVVLTAFVAGFLAVIFVFVREGVRARSREAVA